MNNFGYYGKTRHRGDFVRYNLPRTFVSVWDDWMQQLLLRGEETHDTEWKERYLDGTGYWFALSPGIAGEMAWGGIMIPSVDKVGRRFPFCLAAALPEGMPAVVAPARLNSTFRALDELAAGINSPDLDFDKVQRQLEELAGTVEPTVAAIAAAPSPSEDREVEPSDAKVQVHVDGYTLLDNTADTTSLLDVILVDTVFQYSVWIARDVDVDRAGMFLTSGLPIDRSGVALFDADWAGTSSRLMKASVTTTEDTDPDVIALSGDETAVPAGAEPGALPAPENPTDTSWSAQCADPPMPSFVTSVSTESGRAAVNADNAAEVVTDAASLSTGDWTEFATGVARESVLEERETPVIIPTIEPLEIEEDVDESEPWDP